jgi:IS605 OrfB family transposase
LRREQRCLSRKYENLKKGESTQRANIQKQKLKVQRLHHKIDNIRTDYISIRSIAEIVKTKPSYITIEDLNVSGMMKNRHLSKAVASQKFYEFRTSLKAKCDENGIELKSSRQMVSIIQNMSLLWCYQERFESFQIEYYAVVIVAMSRIGILMLLLI